MSKRLLIFLLAVLVNGCSKKPEAQIYGQISDTITWYAPEELVAGADTLSGTRLGVRGTVVTVNDLSADELTIRVPVSNKVIIVRSTVPDLLFSSKLYLKRTIDVAGTFIAEPLGQEAAGNDIRYSYIIQAEGLRLEGR